MPRYKALFLWLWASALLLWRIGSVPGYTDFDGGSFLLRAYLPAGPSGPLPACWHTQCWFPLFFQIARYSLRWFGANLSVLHAASALLATLTPPLIYVLARKLVSDAEAFLSSFLLASSFWFLSFHRFYSGFHNLEILLSAAIILLAAISAVHQSQAAFYWSMGASALLLMNGIHIAVPGVLIFMVVIATTGLWRRFTEPASWLWLLAALGLTLGFLAWHSHGVNLSLYHTIVEEYPHHYLSKASAPASLDYWARFGLRKTLQVFVFLKDLLVVSSGALDSYWGATIGRPLLVWPLPVFFVLGFIRCLRRRQPMDLLLIFSIAAYILAFSYLMEYNARRYAAVMVFVYLMIGREILYWWDWLKPNYSKTFAALCGLLWMGFTLRDWNDLYFHEERINPVGTWQEKGHREIAEFLQTRATDQTFIIHGGAYLNFHAYSGARFLNQLIDFDRYLSQTPEDPRFTQAEPLYLILPMRQFEEDNPAFWKNIVSQLPKIRLEEPRPRNFLYEIPKASRARILKLLRERNPKIRTM